MAKEGRSIVVVDAPTNVGLSPPGVGREPGVYGLASALRANGIVSRLGATDGGTGVSPPYKPEIDPSTGVRNGEALRSFSLDLAEKVGAVVQEGKFPFVLGGDCSILIGNMLALRRRGRFGLVFIDGDTWTFDIPATRNSSARPRAPIWPWSAAGGQTGSRTSTGWDRSCATTILSPSENARTTPSGGTYTTRTSPCGICGR
jgi:arginase family enzyme